MKRFALFCYQSYYPSGGWHDFTGSFETFDDACNAGHLYLEKEVSSAYFHIVDLSTGSLMEEWDV